MRINRLLASACEDINAGQVGPNEAESFEEGTDLATQEGDLDAAATELNSVEEAQQKLEEIKDAQDINIKVMEEDKAPEDVVTEVVASGEENAAVVPAEGGAEVSEVVLSEKLPEDEAAAVDTIEAQMQNEQLVVESIAGTLGFVGTFSKSATAQLYAELGLRTGKPGLVNCNEARGTSNARAHAIQLYKAHSEGIGETAKRLATSAWEGVKKFINKVIEFLASIFTAKGRIAAAIDKMDKQGNEILANIDKYEFNDKFKDGYKEVSSASVILGAKDPGGLIKSFVEYASTIASLHSQNDLKKVFSNGKGFNQQLTTYGAGDHVKFKSIGDVDSVKDLADIVESLNLKFAAPKDLVQQVVIIAQAFRGKVKEFMANIDKMNKMLNKIKSEMEKVLSGDDKELVMKAMKLLLIQAQFVSKLPKACVGACKLGLSGVSKKKEEKKAS